MNNFVMPTGNKPERCFSPERRQTIQPAFGNLPSVCCCFVLPAFNRALTPSTEADVPRTNRGASQKSLHLPFQFSWKTLLLRGPTLGSVNGGIRNGCSLSRRQPHHSNYFLISLGLLKKIILFKRSLINSWGSSYQAFGLRRRSPSWTASLVRNCARRFCGWTHPKWSPALLAFLFSAHIF